MGVWKSELHGNDDKLPTVAQWMKTVNSDAWGVTRLVKLIWTPNLYDNFSLDTEVYRFRVSPSHSLFEVLEENLELWVENMSVLALQLDSGKKSTMTLLTLDNEQAEWTALGANGWRLGQVEAKPKAKREYKTRKLRAPEQPPLSEPPEEASDLAS